MQAEFNRVHIRRTVEDDLPRVAENMRAIDRLECLLGGDRPPIDALTAGLRADFETYTILSNDTDEPLAIFGIGPMSETAHYVWLLGTDALLPEAGFQFARESRKWVSYLVNKHGLPCFNRVHKDNLIAIRWLRFCSAEFGEPIYDFIPFTLYPSCVTPYQLHTL